MNCRARVISNDAMMICILNVFQIGAIANFLIISRARVCVCADVVFVCHARHPKVTF
jgi:hypothetical protein